LYGGGVCVEGGEEGRRGRGRERLFYWFDFIEQKETKETKSAFYNFLGSLRFLLFKIKGTLKKSFFEKSNESRKEDGQLLFIGIGKACVFR
jgi:hypothetical protein